MGAYLLTTTAEEPHEKNTIVQRAFKQVTKAKSSHRLVQIMTYNVLADRLVSITKASEEFEYRAPRIVEEIKQSGADILCLQEIDRYDDFYEPRFKQLGYQVVLKSRPTKAEGIAIAFNHSKFELKRHEFVDFDDLVRVYNNDQTYKRENQALICELYSVAMDQRIIVACAHLHWNPRIDFVKMAQALYLKEQLVQFMKKIDGAGLPLLIGGDFNSLPVSSVLSVMQSEDILGDSLDKSVWRIPAKSDQATRDYYNLIAQNYKNSKKDLAPVEGKLWSVYNALRPEGKSRTQQQPVYTNYTATFKGTLDHIFINDKCELVALLEMPEHRHVQAEASCPSDLFPSDHLRMEALIYLK